MRRSLVIHPILRCPAVTTITVDVERPSPTTLSLTFTLAGDLAALRIPPHVAGRRTDELWKQTCFEAFLRPAGGEAYYELNLAPSTQWAAYRFDGYRQGMAAATVIDALNIGTRTDDDQFVLAVALDLTDTPDLAGALRLGASAVIETADGALSYWALAHPAGRPDFHHADGFVLDLAPPGIP